MPNAGEFADQQRLLDVSIQQIEKFSINVGIPTIRREYAPELTPKWRTSASLYALNPSK